MAENEPQEFDPIIRSEVSRIWQQWVGMDPDLPAAARAALIDREAARLTGIAEELEERRHAELIEQWRNQRQGEEPEVLEAATLIQTAQRAARNEVLEAELYPQVTDEIRDQVGREQGMFTEGASEETRRLRKTRDPDRWRRTLVEDSELAQQIASRVWGSGESLDFMVLATSLIAQRLEDNQPTPVNRADPQREQLDAMIREELARQQQTPS